MVRFILAEGLRLAATGVVIGVLAALAAARLTRSVVIDVSPTDPRVLSAVAIVMLTVAALAALIPARRASAVDPMVVLRHE